jgi:beta-galactosidase
MMISLEKDGLRRVLAVAVILALTIDLSARAFAQGVEFNRAFAPQAGLVSRYEEPWRQEICLNGSWQFRGDQDTSTPGETVTEPGDWEATPIKVPSPWNVNAFSTEGGMPGGDFRAYPSYPAAWERLPAAWLEKSVAVPGDWTGKRVLLHFGAVGGELVAYVNGHRVGGGLDIFFAQDFDVTQFVTPGKTIRILVKVISSHAFDRPGQVGHREYLSGSFWGTFVSGLWQDVYLLAEPPVAMGDVFVEPLVNQDELRLEATVENHGTTPATVEVAAQLKEWINDAGNSVREAPEVKWHLARRASLELPGASVSVASGEVKKVEWTAKVDGRLKLWSPAAPNLYGALLTISAGGQPVDVSCQRFGWRQFTIQGNQLCLNGQPITLRGDSWHFMGVPQMTRRYAWAWYRMLKDAGGNAVRLHASVYPSFYHDMADEMGIMILDESAIWASDGGPKADSDVFWTNCRAHVTKLVRRDRNHPSVFGWSVCNEILPVLRGVWHTPQPMVDRCLDEISAWAEICRTNDPTRPWISGDGEWDANGRLPVINIHYGGDGDLQRAQDSGKPFAVGETSMAYYGTPKQVSQFNGNRAYESDMGRMEGLAYECYELLTSQQRHGANYQSVFNLAWYSLQPLPLGKSALTNPPSLNEGIFFGPGREGRPGMQPERLGPYTSNLNPGYDPALPLYRPWPMFEAIRDANLGATHSRWANRPAIGTANPPAAPLAPGAATISYLPENGAPLAQELSKAGVAASVYSGRPTDFLLVDGRASQAQPETLKGALDQTLATGGTVWVWNVQPAGAAALGKMLGRTLIAGPRVASSFVVKAGDPLLSGLDNAGLYFSEADDWRQMTCGLGGDLVTRGKVVLEACPTNWRKWNYQGEPVKTAALFRSEKENPAPRAAIVICPLNPGRVILCNLVPDIQSARKLAVVQRLFRNEGVPLAEVVAQNDFVDLGGRLVRALVCGSFGVTNVHAAYGDTLPFAEARDGGELAGRRWRLNNAGDTGVFDFKNGLVHGPQENAVAYVAVWIKSPRPLDDLLAEPNLPRLSFIYGADDGCQVWLNGRRLANNERTGPLEPEAFSVEPLLLKLGWNQLVVKVVQVEGEWKFAGRFGCSEVSFMRKLEFAGEPAGRVGQNSSGPPKPWPVRAVYSIPKGDK